jgi:hypothetical protein
LCRDQNSDEAKLHFAALAQSSVLGKRQSSRSNIEGGEGDPKKRVKVVSIKLLLRSLGGKRDPCFTSLLEVRAGGGEKRSQRSQRVNNKGRQ